MEVFMDLISYFGISAIGECETFPQLIQSFFYSIMALYLIVCTVRILFNATWQISRGLK